MSAKYSTAKAVLKARLAGSGLSPRLLEAHEAAAYCGLSPNQFRAEVRAGTLPGPVKGLKCKYPRWDISELDRAIDARSGGTRSGDPILARIHARKAS
jgi:hypothetical protein